MAKAALLVLDQSTLDFVEEIKDRFNLEFICMKITAAEEAEKFACEAENAGADIIIALGLQSLLSGKITSIPVVNIRLTGQDIAMLINEAKERLVTKRPEIALIIYSCMFRRTTHLGELLGVELKIYMLDEYENAGTAVAKAAHDGAHIIIGSRDVNSCAEALGIPSLNVFSGKEGIESALQNAELLSNTIDLEKKNSAENTAYMNSIFHGIIVVNKRGEISRINDYAKNLFSSRHNAAIGRSVLNFFPSLGKDNLDKALTKGEQVFSVITRFKNTDLVTNIEPINFEGEIIGAVITVQKGQRIHEIATELRKELYTRGFVAKYRFEDLICTSPKYGDLIMKAKKFSGSNAPVLIHGEDGTETLLLAQCIYNESSRSGNGFIELECDAWEADHIDEMLFGVKHRLSEEYYARSLIEMAEDGTIFLNHVEMLSEELQYKICKLIRGQFYMSGETRQLPANVRVIASTDKNLALLLKEGKFRSDLYYALNVLTLDVPPLRERKEDIEGWINHFLDFYCNQYSRPVHIIRGAYECMCEYTWPGNIRQLENFCHRIVLLTTRRNIDEAFVRSQIESMDQLISVDQGKETITIYKDKNASKIVEALKHNCGNRTETARELDISKTTLWRLMQKYGITSDYSQQ